MFHPVIYCLIQNIHQEEDDDESDPKTKNIRQTEMVIDLRNAIHQICRHFSLCDEPHEKEINMQVRKI